MDEVIKNLESLGFTNYESRVFYVLFKGRLMTATEVAKEARIPRSSSYDILKLFAEKGICNEIQTSSVAQYELIDPKVVEDKIEKEIHSTYTTKISRLKESFGKLHPIFEASKTKVPKTDVELIKGFNAHRVMKFRDLVKSAESEILFMNKLEGKIYPELDEIAINFHRNGGVTKSIYEASNGFKIKIDDKWQHVNSKGLVDICKKFSEQGEQIRLSKNVPQIMAIVDRRVTLISLLDPSIDRHNRSDIIIKNEKFANFMTDLFIYHWENSQTVDEFENTLNNSHGE